MTYTVVITNPVIGSHSTPVVLSAAATAAVKAYYGRVNSFVVVTAIPRT